MNPRTYRARTMKDALARVRSDLGGEALILSTREIRRRGWFGSASTTFVEVVASSAASDRQQSPKQWRRDEGRAHRWASERFGGSSQLREQLDEPLRRLHSAIEELSRQGRVEHLLPDLPPSLAAPYARLLEQEVPEPLARRVARMASDLVEADELECPEAIEAALLRALELAVVVASPIATATGVRRMAALVGPSGVGKTTTIAKVAAAARLDLGLHVGLLTLDARRVAANEPLRTYAGLIDVPLVEATAPEQVQEALTRLGPVDLVLADTPGRAPRDTRGIIDLGRFLSAARPDEIHLVLAASADPVSLRAATAAFAQIGADRLILTKLDETEHLGALLSILGQSGLPVSYLAAGQAVPDDLEPVGRKRLARLILGLDRAGPASNQLG
jgi:flagellar biosynthesis protein FlhF